MVFPHALGLGVASRREDIELEFHAGIAREEIVARLSRACAGVLEILDAVDLPAARKGRQIRESSYRLTGWPSEAADRLAAAPAAILARNEIVVTRGAPGDERSVDIRPFLKSLVFDPAALAAETVFVHTQTGSARVDEVVRLLADAAGVDWRGVAMEKTGMTLE